MSSKENNVLQHIIHMLLLYGTYRTESRALDIDRPVFTHELYVKTLNTYLTTTKFSCPLFRIFSDRVLRSENIVIICEQFLGAGSSITLVSSLCVTADLIGPHSHQGAAIYSIVTFADKLVTGIAVVAIEN